MWKRIVKIIYSNLTGLECWEKVALVGVCWDKAEAASAGVRMIISLIKGCCNKVLAEGLAL